MSTSIPERTTLPRLMPDEVVDRLREVLEAPDLEGTRYELGAALGRGGMGTVWRARDRELGREVALKVIDFPEEGMAARLRREAQVLARLEHPGIVPVHDVGQLPDGRVFYVMKLVRGRRLDAVAREGQGRGELLRIVERLCEAVAFAHAQGVLHRDLKPENVMVGAFGEVLVMDWGLAKVLAHGPAEERAAGEHAPEDGARTGHGTVLGTPGYMAPEQERGEIDRLDARADVYALGAILHFLVAGAPPSAGVARALPRPLRAICAKALSPLPGDRYASAGALAEDLSRYLQQLPVVAYREGPLERAWRLAVKYRTPLLLVLAYMLMRVALLLVTGR